jgi:hypothetical protein
VQGERVFVISGVVFFELAWSPQCISLSFENGVGELGDFDAFRHRKVQRQAVIGHNRAITDGVVGDLQVVDYYVLRVVNLHISCKIKLNETFIFREKGVNFLKFVILE